MHRTRQDLGAATDQGAQRLVRGPRNSSFIRARPPRRSPTPADQVSRPDRHHIYRFRRRKHPGQPTPMPIVGSFSYQNGVGHRGAPISLGGGRKLHMAVVDEGLASVWVTDEHDHDVKEGSIGVLNNATGEFVSSMGGRFPIKCDGSYSILVDGVPKVKVENPREQVITIA